MAFVTSGICEIKLHGQVADPPGAGIRTVNVFHYAQVVAQSTLPDPATMINTFIVNVVTPLLPLLHEDYTVTLVTARWMDLHSNPEVEVSQSTKGVKAGDRLPTFNAVVFQLRTPFRGKEFRGSKHFAAIAEADTTEDQLVDPALTQWRNFATNLGLTWNIGGQALMPVVLSRKLSQLQKDPVTLQAAPVNGVLLNATIGTMRKRKLKTVIA